MKRVLCFCALFFVMTVHSGNGQEIPQVEYDALVALYNSTNGPNWKNNTGWLQTNTPCNWYGVTCNAGHVTSLSLPENKLSGSIPPELGNLTNLEVLGLWGNGLIGNIPPELGNLTKLRQLYLFGNNLNGSIPPELGNLTSLEILWLTNEQLEGNIPGELGNLTNLKNFFLTDSKISGNIPPQLGNLAKLEKLHLQKNQLSGSIPLQLGNLGNLKELYLYNNQLSGGLPSQLGNLTKLQKLHLFSNKLSGIIPRELGNLDSLRTLWLDQNQLSGNIPPELGNLSNLHELHLYSNNLSGSIPRELGNLTSLETIWLNQNQLNGSIPSQLGNLSNLRLLYLWDNQLSGNIPSELGQLTNLRKLRLSGNQLSGSIPSQLGNLTKLQELHLFNNKLSGIIPQELGNLDSLRTLWLDQNQLNGSIPSELGNLAGLEELHLHVNQLSGSIPSQLGNLTNLKSLWLYQNQLSGSIPSTFGNLAKLENLHLQVNQLSGSIPSQLGNLVNLSELSLYNNQLSGSIPATLSRLTNLQILWLTDNQLSGAVPSWLGNLTKLHDLHLNGNLLTGVIPSELGRLINLQALSLSRNDLTGGVPTELGNLVNLQRFALYENRQLTGPLPLSLTKLTKLWRLWFQDTGLCEPPDPAFQAWLSGIKELKKSGIVCNQPAASLITGSFVIAKWYKGDEGREPYRSLLGEMKSLNLRTVILHSIGAIDCSGHVKPDHFVSYEDIDWMLSEAQSETMDVYIGLYDSDMDPPECEFWHGDQRDPIINQSVEAVKQIEQRFGTRPALKGYYVVQEAHVGKHVVLGPNGINQFYEDLISQVHLAAPNKSVIAGGYMNHKEVPLDSMKNWVNSFKSNGLDIFLLQDGVGSFDNSITAYPTIYDYFLAAREGASPKPLWADVELFQWSAIGSLTKTESPNDNWLHPANTIRINQQIYLANEAGAAEKISWINQRHMTFVARDSYTAFGKETAHLYRGYKALYFTGTYYDNPSYSYDPQPSPQYPDSGGGMLFDNTEGQSSLSEWVGFEKPANSKVTIDVDLGAIKPVSDVTAVVRSDLTVGISYPATMTVKVSTDSINYSFLGSINNPYTNTPTYSKAYLWISAPSSQQARYVKIEFVQGGGSLFISELEVYGGAESSVSIKKEERSRTPNAYWLMQNCPNPFNPTTTIRYMIPKNSDVKLKVYNLNGQEVATLVNEKKSAGEYEVRWSPDHLPSGVYFYRLQADDFVQTKKLVLVK